MKFQNSYAYNEYANNKQDEFSLPFDLSNNNAYKYYIILNKALNVPIMMYLVIIDNIRVIKSNKVMKLGRLTIMNLHQKLRSLSDMKIHFISTIDLFKIINKSKYHLHIMVV